MRIDKIDKIFNDETEDFDPLLYDSDFLDKVVKYADIFMRREDNYESLICEKDNVITYTDEGQEIFNEIYDYVYDSAVELMKERLERS